jgi:hypothetical protein
MAEGPYTNAKGRLVLNQRSPGNESFAYSGAALRPYVIPGQAKLAVAAIRAADKVHALLYKGRKSANLNSFARSRAQWDA